MSKKLKDVERPEQGFLSKPERDPRITSAVEGIRFHSAKHKAQCQKQIDEMLAIQLKSMASAMYEDHRRQQDELRAQIFRLQDRLHFVSRRHIQDVIVLLEPQVNANTMGGQQERSTR